MLIDFARLYLKSARISYLQGRNVNIKRISYSSAVNVHDYVVADNIAILLDHQISIEVYPGESNQSTAFFYSGMCPMFVTICPSLVAG